MEQTKKSHLMIDIVIGLLVVAIIILIDHLVMNLQSKSADEDWSSSAKATEDNGDSADKAGSIDGSTRLTMTISPGERAFVPILNFHHIAKAPEDADKITKSFYVEPQKFEEIIKGLIDEGYEGIFASEAVKYLQERKLPQNKIVAITFDDGNEDFYTNAWPILQKYNVKSSMYIMTGVRGADWLTEDQIKELDKSGLVEFGSHTVWHPKLTKISADEINRELVDSKEYLEKLLNKKVEILCYPFGIYNDEVKAKAQEAGYLAGLTFDQDAWQDPEDLFALTRISVYPELNVLKFLEKLQKF